MKVETVVFDLGGVLIDWDPRHLYRKIFNSETDMNYFLDNVCTQEWNAEQDAGRSWKEAVQLLQAEFPDYTDAIAAYDERWQEMLGPEQTQVIDVLHQVSHTGIPLFALTNWSGEKFPFARKRFHFLDLFQDILVSGDVGMKKPDTAIFQLFLDKYALSGSSTFYVDDNLQNVQVASSVGMQAFQFTDANQLRNDLINLGVLK